MISVTLEEKVQILDLDLFILEITLDPFSIQNIYIVQNI